jgi:thiamine-phosphate diphosphorylase
VEFPRGTGSFSAAARAVPPLHVVTDDELLERPELASVARTVLEAGRGELALHLRGPRTGGRRLYELARQLAPAARAAGALFLVNDRCDVALAAGADGVHLAQRSLDAFAARKLVGERMMLGLSVHPSEQGEFADPGGLDYLFVGTLHPTRSHPGRPGSGPSVLRVLAGCGLPLVGIGGITPDRVAEVRREGGAGVAVLRGVWDAPDPVAAVEAYISQWSAAE